MKISITLEPLIKEILVLPQKLHDKAKRLLVILDVEVCSPGSRRSQTPPSRKSYRLKNMVKCKTYFSSKKKRYIVKTQFIVNFKCLI